MHGLFILLKDEIFDVAFYFLKTWFVSLGPLFCAQVTFCKDSPYGQIFVTYLSNLCFFFKPSEGLVGKTQPCIYFVHIF